MRTNFRTIPSSTRIHDVLCDICRSERATWDKYLSTNVVMSDPEGDTMELDVCPACFKTFILPLKNLNDNTRGLMEQFRAMRDEAILELEIAKSKLKAQQEHLDKLGREKDAKSNTLRTISEMARANV